MNTLLDRIPGALREPTATTGDRREFLKTAGAGAAMAVAGMVLVFVLGLILESFNSLPIGTNILNQAVYGRVLQWSSMMFLGAVLMALPVMVSLLFINVGLGVVTRAAPSLNIFAVGFPALIIGGFLILIMSLESIGARIEWLWVQGFNVVRDVMGVPNV